jgi:hypothetical protein
MKKSRVSKYNNTCEKSLKLEETVLLVYGSPK